MADRWHIYRDGKALGPFNAAEIRKQLRDGDLDPFDLVAREGSPLRRELVEVDELFATAPAPAEAQYATDQATQTLGTIDKLVAGEARLPGGFVPPDEVLQGNLVLADAAAANATQVSGSAAPPVRRRKKDPKHYHLRDAKGRVLGPLSATDVQALFYKGVINASVMVMKQGSSAKVPADKFVAVLARSKGGGTTRPRQGAHPAMMSGQQRVSRLTQLKAAQMARLEQVRGTRFLTMVLVVAAVALLGLAGVLAYRNGGGEWIARKFAAFSSPAPETPAKRRPRARPTSVPVKTGGALPRPTTYRPEPRPMPRVERPERKKPERKKPERKKPEKAKPAPVKVVKPPKPVKVTSAVAVAPAKPKPVPKPAPAPAPKPAAPAGPSVAALTDGQTISHFGPMRYDPAAVATRTGACVVAFSGGGGTVTGRFFKDGFGAALAARKGSAYISGIVRKSGGGTMVLIQDVQ
jgi:hypothetical protein